MKHPVYLAYGLAILALMGAAQYRGWSLARVNELRNIPRSVRDNPGSYRSHYAGYSRYIGGK